MFRLVRSAFRTADHFVTSGTTRLKKPLENLLLKVERNVSTAAHSSQSFSNTFSHHLHTQSVARPQPLTSSFSFPTRVALARSPLAAPKLPRAPGIPRSISEVGLGTARNFSSSRHVFQNIIDNVPIHTRALWEVEWDLKQKKAAQKKAIRRENKKQRAERIPDKVKAKENVRYSVASSVASDDEVDSAEFSTYFAAPTNPSLIAGVTTTLTIPLYPPPTRTPLPASSPPDALFPYAELRDMHTSHSAHATRVTSLFTRLGGAEVWSAGARCDQYGELSLGLPTSLKVVFDGWTQERVRRVLGDAGKGWCELVEERREVPELEATLLRSPVQSLPDELDVTSSFILPTLDFSSDFTSHISEPSFDETASTTRATSPTVLSDDEYELHDGWSSGGEESDRFSDDMSIAATPIHRSLGFSVNFLERSGYSDDAQSYY